MKNYPIKITETPHQGKPTTWVLQDEKHLNQILLSDQTCRSNYFNWCVEEGYTVFSKEESEDGDFPILKDESLTLDAYLAWLKHDLSSLDVEYGFTED